uniref:Putative secreted protein n=1 Tax=Anopheles darlingi TaxID=43151 RepID=A0A2M4DRT6_ANODA
MLMLLLLPSMAGGWLTGLPRCTTSRFASSSPKSSSSSSASSLPIPRRRRRGVAQTQHTFTPGGARGDEMVKLFPAAVRTQSLAGITTPPSPPGVEAPCNSPKTPHSRISHHTSLARLRRGHTNETRDSSSRNEIAPNRGAGRIGWG